MGRVKALTDAELAHDYRRHRATEAAAAELAGAAKDQLLVELERRRSTSVEVLGVTVTRKAKTLRAHDVAQLKARVARRLFTTLTKTVVDPGAWAAAVKSGLVDGDVVAAVETKRESAPYVAVTVAEAA